MLLSLLDLLVWLFGLLFSFSILYVCRLTLTFVRNSKRAIRYSKHFWRSSETGIYLRNSHCWHSSRSLFLLRLSYYEKGGKGGVVLTRTNFQARPVRLVREVHVGAALHKVLDQLEVVEQGAYVEWRRADQKVLPVAGSGTATAAAAACVNVWPR